MPTIAADPLRAVVRAMCKAAGSSDYEAELVADNLVGANLAGHDSHGVGMLPWYFECAQAGPNTSTRLSTMTQMPPTSKDVAMSPAAAVSNPSTEK